MKSHQNYIKGQWVSAQSGLLMDVINPASEKVIAQVAKSHHNDVDAAVEAAQKAFPAWKALAVEERIEYLERIYQGIEARKEELAQVIAAELGAPISFSRSGQVGLALRELKASLEEVADFEFEEMADQAKIVKEPYGVVACITPWNYPLNQIQRKITPALLTGNTVVVKPASNTPLTALIYAEIIDQAGLPAGVFNLVTGSGSEVGDYLADHPDVDLISFTGSTEVGKNLYSKAAPQVKQLVLELGGKSAMVYLKGGDLTFAVKKAMDTVIYNQGQTCSAMTRLLVPEECLEETKEAILNYYQEKVVVGDPLAEDTTLGPLVSADQLKRVQDYIELGQVEGAEILIGGHPIDRPGYYFEPTVFVAVDNAMRIAQEEIFGPVLCVLTYQDQAQAIAIANDSIYGLSGGVVGPADQALEVAYQLQTGNIFVNDGPRSPKAPFGGYKQSGLGRENGKYGLEDYLQLKAIFL
ncbi:aldehyde dehydrogenase family protein [Ignavigranum ruoffiae]|uniref:aldehyde dehydrogenase family protein n=1 Tax=Ignavigranum ruoffiae TaxID=89093 RepID=UPI0024ADA0CF|nr:aldehyde dehydrogenase family protein [Ignavigranum ruoffiae]